MRILERHIQTLEKDGRDTYVAKEKQWQALEERLGGFPTKRHFSPLSNWTGTTVVWEREWESFAAMEEAYERTRADPAKPQLSKVPSAILHDQVEIFILMDLG